MTMVREHIARKELITKTLLVIVAIVAIASLPIVAAVDGPTSEAPEREHSGKIASESGGITSQLAAQTSAGGENGSVYVATGDNTFHALDAVTGGEKWSSAQVGHGDRGATVVDGIAYVGTNDDVVYAFDAQNGSIIWSTSIPDNIESTPTVVDGGVYMVSGTDARNSGNVSKLDKDTGNIEWQYDTGGQIQDSSATVVDGRVFVGTDSDGVVAINSETGNPDWSFDPGSTIIETPVVSNGEVFFGTEGGNFYSVDTENGSETWSYTAGDGVSTSPVVVNNEVYFGDDTPGVTAVNASDGSEIWTISLPNFPRVGATVTDGSLYIPEGNNITSIDIDSGTTNWRYETPGTVFSIPTVHNNTVFFTSSNGDVHAIDADTGSEKWTSSIASDIEGSATVVAGNSNESDGTRVRLGTIGHHNYWADLQLPFNLSTGTVTDQDGNPVSGAEVTISGNEMDTAQTESNGNFSVAVSNGTYELEITHENYETYTETITVEEGEYLGTFELSLAANPRLTMDAPTLLLHGENASYTVEYTVETANGNRTIDVTDNATVTSQNADGLTVDEQNHELVATEDVDFNDRVSVRIEYGGSVVFQEVTVAEKDIENIQVLPTMYRFSVLVSDDNMFIIILATLMGIVGTRWSTAFGGLGFFELVMVAGWFGGWLNGGLMLVSVFLSMFIGLNLAANIDYTVRR